MHNTSENSYSIHKNVVSFDLALSLSVLGVGGGGGGGLPHKKDRENFEKDP